MLDNNVEVLKSLDDLLDGTLDDLADMPEFKVYPAGAHHIKINWEVKKIGDQMAPSLKMTYIAALELNNPEDVVPTAGDECETAFLFTNKDKTPNEYAQGGFKQLISDLKGMGVAGNSNREIMEASNGMEVIAITEVRLKDKKDPKSTKYISVKNFGSLT